MSEGRRSELSGLSADVAEQRPVYEEDPKMGRSPLQLQHSDVVGPGGAKQRSRDVKSLLRAPGRPVSPQVNAINPNLALM